MPGPLSPDRPRRKAGTPGADRSDGALSGRLDESEGRVDSLRRTDFDVARLTDARPLVIHTGGVHVFTVSVNGRHCGELKPTVRARWGRRFRRRESQSDLGGLELTQPEQAEARVGRVQADAVWSMSHEGRAGGRGRALRHTPPLSLRLVERV